MKTITKTVNVYSFSELSEEAKETAIEKLWDINISYEWWESTYEDAKNVGIKITSFDLDRNRNCEGDFIDSPEYTAHKIVKEHGEQCNTRKTAERYLAERDELVVEYSDGIDKTRVKDEFDDMFDDKCDELDEEFRKSILEDYSIILQNESEYLSSYEAIKETIEANEYTFTEDGKLYN